MSEHRAEIIWSRETEGFGYREYNREHTWRFDGAGAVRASAAPQYLGLEDHVDPEQALVAAISSCHMLTFLAICSRRGIVVNGYADSAVGHLERVAQGKLAITRVELAPCIRFDSVEPEDSVLEEIHHESHETCFIANSVNTDIKLTRLR